MSVVDKIKGLFSRRPPTEEELAARAEAEATRDQIRQERAAHKAEVDANRPGRP